MNQMPYNLDDYVQVKNSAIHGKGLFAKIDIAKDTIIGVVEGCECQENGEHVLWLENAEKPFKVNNDLKFINHARAANVAYYDDLTVVAIANIKAGDELVHDYGDGWP